jgi:predicted PurR-regulated permease PerM
MQVVSKYLFNKWLSYELLFTCVTIYILKEWDYVSLKIASIYSFRYQKQLTYLLSRLLKSFRTK